MNKKPSLENRYVLFSNGSMLDLLDPLVFKEDIETTVASVALEDGTLKILDCANSPLKIFNEIVGLKKTGDFVRIGQTNWNNLFLVHGEFEYFLAYTYIDNVKCLVATGSNGTYWNFNIADA